MEGTYKNLLCEGLNFATREAYNRFRTNVIFSLPDEKDCKVIGITSSMPSDGKTLTSINLSYSLSQLKKKVLLVECDLRKPSVSEKLKIERTPGLSNFLYGQVDFRSAQRCYEDEDKVYGFDIIPAGDIPPNPSELLSSKSMIELVTKLRQVYDYIILDLPPTGVVVDAQDVARYSDGMILVVRENVAREDILDGCLRQLEFTGVKILGFVVNGALEGSGKGGGYDRYKYYSGYYSRYGSKYYSNGYGYYGSYYGS